MSPKHILVIALFLFLTSCEDEDCSTVLCVGPPSLALRVLQNGSNVFANDIFTLDNIVIEGENSQSIGLSLFENQDGTPILILDNFIFIIGVNEYTLNFNNEAIADLDIEITLSEGDCCSGIPQIRSFSTNGRVTEINDGSYSVSLR